MTELVKFSSGQPMVSMRTKMAITLMRDMHKEVIHVPVSMSTNELMFEFKTTWDRVIQKQISDQTLVDVMRMLLDMWEAMGIGQAYTRVGDTDKLRVTYDPDIIKKISALTGEREDAILYIFSLLEKYINTNLAGQMLTPTLMKSALNAGIPSITKAIRITLADIKRVKGLFNHFFALFVMHAPWSDINQYVKDSISKDPVIVMCKNFIDVFKDTETMHIPMRLSAAYEQMDWNSIGLEPMFRYSRTSVPLVRRLVSVNLPNVSVYAVWDWFWTYLRIHMGGPAVLTGTYTAARFKKAVESGTFVWPGMPKDWLDGVSYTSWRPTVLRQMNDEMEEIFNHIFYLYLLKNAQRPLIGTYRAPFETLLMQKEYKKQDAVTETFTRDWLDPLCLALQLFDSTALDIVKFAQDDSVLHVGVLPADMQRWKQFTEIMLRNYKTMYLDQSHPRYFMQGAILLNQLDAPGISSDFASRASELPSYHYYDKVYDRSGDFVYDASAAEYFKIGLGKIFSSSLINAPIPETPLEHLVPPIAMSTAPFYAMDFPIDSPYVELDTVEFRLRVVSDLAITKMGLQHFLASRLKTLYFYTPDVMAQQLRIPLPLARHLFPGADRCVRMFEGPLTQTVIWEADILPVYECSFDPSVIEGGKYAPFVSVWPFAIKLSRSSFSRAIGGRTRARVLTEEPGQAKTLPTSETVEHAVVSVLNEPVANNSVQQQQRETPSHTTGAVEPNQAGGNEDGGETKE